MNHRAVNVPRGSGGIVLPARPGLRKWKQRYLCSERFWTSRRVPELPARQQPEQTTRTMDETPANSLKRRSRRAGDATGPSPKPGSPPGSLSINIARFHREMKVAQHQPLHRGIRPVNDIGQRARQGPDLFLEVGIQPVEGSWLALAWCITSGTLQSIQTYDCTNHRRRGMRSAAVVILSMAASRGGMRQASLS